MNDYNVKCEVVSTDGPTRCSGAALTEKGSLFILGVKTPEPHGMCAKAFATIYPFALALRFTSEIPWEKGKGYYEVLCPDGKVKFRLSRLHQAVKSNI